MSIYIRFLSFVLKRLHRTIACLNYWHHKLLDYLVEVKYKPSKKYLKQVAKETKLKEKANKEMEEYLSGLSEHKKNNILNKYNPSMVPLSWDYENLNLSIERPKPSLNELRRSD